MLERNASLQTLDISRNALGFHSVHRLRPVDPALDLLEHQGKALFAEAGLPVLQSAVARTSEEARRAAEHLGPRVCVKAQVKTGRRGKAGGIRVCGTTAEAETAYQRVIALDPGGHLAKKTEAGRNRITRAKFRKAGDELRPDVLTYCGDALRMFDAMPKEEVQPINMEIAMLGAKGLSVTDPSIKHQLRLQPGDFSGLHLLCLEYVGFQIIDPSVDIGFDIAAEYEEARRVHGGAR